MRKTSKTKTPASSPKAAPVSTPPTEAFEQREQWHSPHLVDWQHVGGEGKSFHIYEDTGDVPYDKGPLVATVTVSPEFSQRDAAKIVRLMACAPKLFRALRAIGPHSLDHAEGAADFAAAVEAMMLAIGNYPYTMPFVDELEESIGQKLNRVRGRIPIA